MEEDLIYKNGNVYMVVCRYCGRVRSEHADLHCLFQSTTFEAVQTRIDGFERYDQDELKKHMVDCSNENHHALPGAEKQSK